MKVKLESWTLSENWQTISEKVTVNNPQLVLAFGNRQILSQQNHYDEIKAKYPQSEILICSTSGEISNENVSDESLSLTAIEFEHTQLKTYSINISDHVDSFEAGKAIVDQFEKENLKHIFLLSDGQLVNGSLLVKGINDSLNNEVTVTGGLAGDGYEFAKTLSGLNQNPQPGNIIAVGFYGDNIEIGFGTKGGWNVFGPERVVTKSIGNVLYELDGISALELYKKYLGEAANQLPSSALYFPLSIKVGPKSIPIVRTILSIDEDAQSMTFAGDIPIGSFAQLMRHSVDGLVDGAEDAAKQSFHKTVHEEPDLAILVSCVGRKIVLGQNVEEEIEVVRDTFGDKTPIIGFYSYGEIAPFENTFDCNLHNQTMTITTFKEHGTTS